MTSPSLLTSQGVAQLCDFDQCCSKIYCPRFLIFDIGDCLLLWFCILCCLLCWCCSVSYQPTFGSCGSPAGQLVLAGEGRPWMSHRTGASAWPSGAGEDEVNCFMSWCRMERVGVIFFFNVELRTTVHGRSSHRLTKASNDQPALRKFTDGDS